MRKKLSACVLIAFVLSGCSTHMYQLPDYSYSDHTDANEDKYITEFADEKLIETGQPALVEVGLAHYNMKENVAIRSGIRHTVENSIDKNTQESPSSTGES